MSKKRTEDNITPAELRGEIIHAVLVVVGALSGVAALVVAVLTFVRG